MPECIICLEPMTRSASDGRCGSCRATGKILERPVKHSMDEAQEQRALAEELRWRIGRPGEVGKGGVFWMAQDLGNTSARDGAMRRERGCVAGVPDLYFRRGAHTWWIELKRVNGGQVSAAQVRRHLALSKLGDPVAVCHGAKAAIEQLEAWGILK